MFQGLICKFQGLFVVLFYRQGMAGLFILAPRDLLHFSRAEEVSAHIKRLIENIRSKLDLERFELVRIRSHRN
jgi:hypothetical protein